jgi:Fic family protein
MVSQQDAAAEWLTQNTRDRPPVFLEDEVPRDVLKALDRAGLTSRVPGAVIVVRSPGDNPEAVKKALFWSIVEKIAQRYQPAVLERDSAVRLHIGQTTPDSEIRVRHGGQSRWRQDILPGISLRLEHGAVRDPVTVQVGEARLPVDPPERVLLTLPVGFLRDQKHLAELSLWLKSLVLARPAVVEAYREDPRPVVLKRIADLARDAGNERLAALLNDVIDSEQSVRISKGRTGVGREIIVPQAIVELPTTRQPWLDRLRLAIRESRKQMEGIVPEHLVSHAERDLSALLETARAAKAYDAYHSSSIEGYRLRLEEVAAFLRGGSGEGPSIEDVRARLAIVGYSTAFDALLQRYERENGNLSLNSNLALDLYTDLFTPSVEAGLLEREDLRRFRNGPVFIRDTLYTPPNADKVPALLDLLFDEIEAIPAQQGYLRGTLAHLWFVWIHPFLDGNGRVARFLMISALLSSGEPWLTIRVEQRDEYFAALRRAQLHDDFGPFAEFIASSARAAAVK